MRDHRALAAAPSRHSDRAIVDRLFDERNFPAAAPPVQFLLAPDRILHVAKVLKPNEPAQMIAFREAFYLARIYAGSIGGRWCS